MKSFLITLFLAFPILVNAQVKYDTLSVRQIADGVYHYTVEAPSVPWSIQVVEVDLTNPEISLETVKAKDKLFGYETVSSMTTRKSYDGHEVVAGVNGDFYGNGGVPTNTQVLNGEILRKPISREVFGFNNLGDLFIERTSYLGNIINGQDTLSISNMNSERDTNQLIFYNHYFGESTNTNQYGTELVLKAIDPWVVNGKVRATVIEKRIDIGNTLVTDSTFVLSGHGEAASSLNKFAINDTIIVEHNLLSTIDNMLGAVGGYGVILTNGVKTGNWPERHPRTAVGYNKEKTKLFLLTVDGRQSSSAGMTLQEMGDYMLTIGAYNALNLDGGGSTTMVVHNSVVNEPSGGGVQRTVSNGLMVVSKAPKIGTASRVNLTPDFIKLYKTSSFQFEAEGTDANHYPVDLRPEIMNYYLSDGLDATISNSGELIAGSTADTGMVYLEYEGVIDSSLVIIKSIDKLNLFPITATTDTSRTIEFYTEVFDFDNQRRYINNSEIKWLVENQEVGSVSEDGIFKGKMNGTTKVIAQYESISDTSIISVEIKNGNLLLDSFEDIEGWTIDGENVDLANTKISLTDSISSEGSKSMKIDYEYTYDNKPTILIHLKKDFTVFGVPDSIVFDVISDGKKHLVDVLISDNDDELFDIRVKKYVQNTNFDFYPALLENSQPVNDGAHFFLPITIKGITIRIASDREDGKLYKGTFFLDNLRLVFPKEQNPVSNEIVKGEEIPSDFVLNQNYPNPFNPSTQISFSLPKASKTQLKVYDLLGREVKVLLNERLSSGTYNLTFDASDLSSGVYLYQLKTDTGVLSKKMTLIK